MVNKRLLDHAAEAFNGMRQKKGDLALSNLKNEKHHMQVPKLKTCRNNSHQLDLHNSRGTVLTIMQS